MSYIPGQKYDSICGVLQSTQFPLCYDLPQSSYDTSSCILLGFLLSVILFITPV